MPLPYKAVNLRSDRRTGLGSDPWGCLREPCHLWVDDAQPLRSGLLLKDRELIPGSNPQLLFGRFMEIASVLGTLPHHLSCPR